MSKVILNFAEEPDTGTLSDGHLLYCEGDLPVPRVGETVHIDQRYRVTDVLYDLGSGQIEYPEVWITVEPLASEEP